MKKILLLICLLVVSSFAARKDFTGADSASNLNWGNDNNWYTTTAAGTADTAVFGDSTLSMVAADGNKVVSKLVLTNSYPLNYAGQIQININDNYAPLVTTGDSIVITTLKIYSVFSGSHVVQTLPTIWHKGAYQTSLETGDVKLTHGKVKITGTFLSANYNPIDTMVFTDTVICGAYNNQVNGSEAAWQYNTTKFGASIWAVVGDVDHGSTNYLKHKDYLETSKWYVGGNWRAPTRSEIFDAGTSVVTLNGSTACFYQDQGRTHYDITVNKTTDAGTWAFTDTADTTICNDLTHTDGQARWYKNLRFRDGTFTAADTAEFRADRIVGRDVTFGAGTIIKNTAGKWVMLSGSHTFTNAGKKIDSLYLAAGADVNFVGSDTVVNLSLNASHLQIQNGDALTMLSYSMENNDTLMSNSSGVMAYVNIPQADTMTQMRFKDITFNVHVSADSTCITLGNNRNLKTLSYYGTATLSIDSGVTDGGTSITVEVPGGFIGGGATLGGDAVTGWAVSTYKTATFTTPAHAAGAVDLIMWNTDNDTTTIAGAFTYYSACTPPTISYASALVCTVGVAITPVDATIGGGTCDSVQVIDALPAGLTLTLTGANQGRVSGTPTTAAAETAYTIRAYGCDSADAELTITVICVAPTISYSTVIDTVGTAFSQTAIITGLYDSIVAIDALPGGLTLNPTTGAITGTSTTPSVKTAYQIRIYGLYVCDSADTYDTITIRDYIPTITAVSPDHGITAGGYGCVITGTMLAFVDTIYFGAELATIRTTAVTRDSVTVPAHVAGVVDVIVCNSAGRDTLANGFEYANIYGLSISPTFGDTSGGTTITVSAEYGLSGGGASLNDKALASWTVIGGASATGITPANDRGATAGWVYNAAGDSVAISFNYTARSRLARFRFGFGFGY